METIVIFDGEQFLCRYFLDMQFLNQGIDIVYLPTMKFVGMIPDLIIPDAKDLDAVFEFESVVIKWLENQDVNYTMGK